MALSGILVDILLNVAIVVALMIAVTAGIIIGKGRLMSLRAEFMSRIRQSLPYLVVLGVALGVNSLARDYGPTFSWIFGWNITGILYQIEGPFVGTLQGLTPEFVIPFFSFMYVYGYTYLLVFPLVAYLALDDPKPLRRLAIAYTFNYVVGVSCYLLFIAYGPRNIMPSLVEPLLYSNWPRSQILTSEVNTNTNVFPSLHASLSTTVAILAYKTKEIYQGWLYISVFFALAVSLSTMVLGIHWGIDVVAGVLLAIGSVRVAEWTDQHLQSDKPENERKTEA